MGIFCGELWGSGAIAKQWDVAQILGMPGAEVMQVKQALANRPINVEVMLVDNRTKKKAMLYYADGRYFGTCTDDEMDYYIEDSVERKLVLTSNDLSFRFRSQIALMSEGGVVKARHELRAMTPLGTTQSDLSRVFKDSLEWT